MRCRRLGRRCQARRAGVDELTQLDAELRELFFSWARADYATTAGAKTTAVQDSVAIVAGNARSVDPDHMFTIPGEPQMPGAPAADAALGGQLSMAFPGTAYLDSTLDPEHWTFIHDGSGSARMFLFVPEMVTASRILSASIHTSAGGGHQDATQGSSTQKLGCDTRATGVLGGTSLVTTTLLQNGVGYYQEYRFRDDGVSPEASLRINGTMEASGNTSTITSPDPPSHTMCIGSRGNRAVPWVGRIAEAAFFKGDWTSVLRAKYARYVLLKYGDLT